MGCALPYKQRVTGSNPVAPTLKISHLQSFLCVAFFFCSNSILSISFMIIHNVIPYLDLL